jgi:hypothetical protein
MAASDAKLYPVKNVAFRVTFPILDADGDPVTGATGLDSEVSKDGAAFADAGSEATEIGTSGIYFLDLTAGEMNADTVVVQVKTTSSGAKTTVLIFYPLEAGDTNAFADDLLARDLGSGSGAGTLNERTVRSALRTIRNKTSVSAGTMTVTKEDDTASAWTAAVTTNAAADPITSIDPA